MLVKIEVICTNCDNQYILAVKKEDQKEVLHCPFCTIPLEKDEEETE